MSLITKSPSFLPTVALNNFLSYRTQAETSFSMPFLSVTVNDANVILENSSDMSESCIEALESKGLVVSNSVKPEVSTLGTGMKLPLTFVGTTSPVI